MGNPLNFLKKYSPAQSENSAGKMTTDETPPEVTALTDEGENFDLDSMLKDDVLLSDNAVSGNAEVFSLENDDNSLDFLQDAGEIDLSFDDDLQLSGTTEVENAAAVEPRAIPVETATAESAAEVGGLDSHIVDETLPAEDDVFAVPATEEETDELQLSEVGEVEFFDSAEPVEVVDEQSPAVEDEPEISEDSPANIALDEVSAVGEPREPELAKPIAAANGGLSDEALFEPEIESAVPTDIVEENVLPEEEAADLTTNLFEDKESQTQDEFSTVAEELNPENDEVLSGEDDIDLSYEMTAVEENTAVGADDVVEAEDMPFLSDVNSDNQNEGSADEAFYSIDENDKITSEVEETALPDDGYLATDEVTPSTVMESTVVNDKQLANFIKWYSGSSEDSLFEVSKQTEPTTLVGTALKSAIHVNVGYDTYGWLVEFANGQVMSLRDVREYQIRNGKLPAADGVIIYGGKRIEFQGIERILLYESVQYFSYGI